MSLTSMFNDVSDRLERIGRTVSDFMNGYTTVEVSAPSPGSFLHRLAAGEPASNKAFMNMLDADAKEAGHVRPSAPVPQPPR